MPPNRRHRVPEVFAEDNRQGANSQVYCKGCGQSLEGQPRHVQSRTPVAIMMCASCREKHGHELIPASGAVTFCYRCGGEDEIFLSKGMSPVTYHVCPRCVPERVARYRTGDFETPPPPPPAEQSPPAGTDTAVLPLPKKV